jgi:hypothetical protein
MRLNRERERRMQVVLDRSRSAREVRVGGKLTNPGCCAASPHPPG